VVQMALIYFTIGCTILISRSDSRIRIHRGKGCPMRIGEVKKRFTRHRIWRHDSVALYSARTQLSQYWTETVCPSLCVCKYRIQSL